MRPHLGALLSVFLVGATPQDEPFTPVGVHPITSFEGLVATGSAASAPASPKAKPSPIHVSLETSSSCVVSSWGMWGACSATCLGEHGGEPSRMRRRSLLKRPENGGWACPALFEHSSTGCSQRRCPIDCAVGAFQGWGRCTRPCRGEQYRFREAVRPAQYGGQTCPHTKEARPCSAPQCPKTPAEVMEGLEHEAFAEMTTAQRNQMLYGGGSNCTYARGKLGDLSERHLWFGKGYGSAWCRDCLCYDGRLVCTKQSCEDPDDARPCSHMTCGMYQRGHRSMTMVVRHARGERNGPVHHCQLDRSTAKCKCTCYSDPRQGRRRMLAAFSDEQL